MSSRPSHKVTRADLSFSRLLPFAKQAYPPFRVAEHHIRIAQALVAVERGEIKRLIITMPPRHGKSLLCSELFPAWYMGRNPNRQMVAASHTQELADDFGRKVRNLMRDPLYQTIFPGVALREDSTSAKRFHTTAGGVYVAVGVGGPLTGRGSDICLVDDPIKSREDADSETMRRKLKDWFAEVAYTRLMPGGAVILIQTRWHSDDLAGWLLREHADEGWNLLSLPALDEQGKALWSSQYPVEALEDIRKMLGSRGWEALYQQRPSPAEGGLFKRAWLQNRYGMDPKALEGQCEAFAQSWDLSFKGSDGSDWVVGQAWGRKGADRYLLDQIRARMDFPETMQAFRDFSKKWPRCTAKLVEDKANGPALIASLKREIGGIIAINPKDSKEARASTVAPLLEAGNIHFPASAPWVGDLVEEMAGFPRGSHDDQVDALTQYLSWDLARSGPVEFTSFGRSRVSSRLEGFQL